MHGYFRWRRKGSCSVTYRASHEEADDRMMFSIHQLYQKYTIGSPFIKDSLSITVVTPDTDIFVVLMYNLQKRLERFWVIFFTLQIRSKVIDQLPAGHALTGCDNVAKVGTKKELLHILNSFDPLITGFGREALDYDMLQQAD